MIFASHDRVTHVLHADAHSTLHLSTPDARPRAGHDLVILSVTGYTRNKTYETIDYLMGKELAHALAAKILEVVIPLEEPGDGKH